MTYKTIYTEVDVDLDDFNDDELIEELEQRGNGIPDKVLIRSDLTLRSTVSTQSIGCCKTS